jgi:hypothetical protein
LHKNRGTQNKNKNIRTRRNYPPPHQVSHFPFYLSCLSTEGDRTFPPPFEKRAENKNGGASVVKREARMLERIKGGIACFESS